MMFFTAVVVATYVTGTVAVWRMLWSVEIGLGKIIGVEWKHTPNKHSLPKRIWIYLSTFIWGWLLGWMWVFSRGFREEWVRKAFEEINERVPLQRLSPTQRDQINAFMNELISD